MFSGPTHLGFTLPYALTWRQGARDKGPSRGICSGCERHREKVYMLGDGRPYCVFCIHFALSDARPLYEQSSPPVIPIETIYERIRSAGGRDDFDSAFWSKALA